MLRLVLVTLCLLGCGQPPPTSTGGRSEDRVDGAVPGEVAPIAPIATGDGAVPGPDTAPDREPPDAGGHAEPGDARGDAAGTLQAIRIIRGDPNQTAWFDLTLLGSGLQEYEGAVVTARIGSQDRPPERLGSGQARIVGGAFQLVFPDVLELGLYKYKHLFIDVNDNGACDGGEPVFSDSSFAKADLVLMVVPGWRLATNGTRCSFFAPPWPEG